MEKKRREGKKEIARRKEKFCRHMESSWKVDRNYRCLCKLKSFNIFWLNKEIFNKILVSVILYYDIILRLFLSWMNAMIFEYLELNL